MNRNIRKAFGLLLLFLPVAIVSTGQTPTPSRNFTFALAGDSIIERRISVFDDPAFLKMIEHIRNADAAFTNFEMLVHHYEAPGAIMSGGTYMQADPFVIDELKWAGFRMFGLANNHSYDYGAEGLLSTIRHFEQAGLTHAGTGENLARARAPGYLDTKKGRVALISCASTFTAISPAGEQRADLIGRPGLSPLHIRTTYTIDAATMNGLRTLGGRGGRGGAGGQQADLNRFGVTFHVGDNPGVSTAPDPKDVAQIVAGVSEARRMADWVVVSIHAHEGMPGNVDVPAEFLPIFAHAVIDAGADVFVGHGPHVLRGIEIYKGKPIFYSMGNFFMQNDLVPIQPQENYETYDLPLDASVADFYDRRNGTTYTNGEEKNTRSFPANKEYWESMLALPVFNGKRELMEIDLYPLTLGYGLTRSQRGFPFPASATEGEAILERVARLSKEMGTTVVLQNGMGVVKIK
jgi:poly-gamma-glutamate capsule biosynthesis protein CapA/YwtB (metallophosphatase superfamily)